MVYSQMQCANFANSYAMLINYMSLYIAAGHSQRPMHYFRYNCSMGAKTTFKTSVLTRSRYWNWNIQKFVGFITILLPTFSQ